MRLIIFLSLKDDGKNRRDAETQCDEAAKLLNEIEKLIETQTTREDAYLEETKRKIETLRDAIVSKLRSKGDSFLTLWTIGPNHLVIPLEFQSVV